MVVRRRSTLATILDYIPVLIMVVIFVFPLYWMFNTSFKQRVDWYALPPRFVYTADRYAVVPWTPEASWLILARFLP